jgi:hypothetical protein
LPIFRLEPIEERLSDPRWEATDLKVGCWVLADDEQSARLRVQHATLRMTDVESDRASAGPPPWEDDALARCFVNQPRHLPVPYGVVVAEDGRTFTVR